MTYGDRSTMAFDKAVYARKPVWVCTRLMSGRLPGKAMGPQKKEVESEWPDAQGLEKVSERRWAQPYQDNHR